MSRTRTQVGIIGGGPAGMLLSHILHKEGIDSIVLERRARNYVLQRIRAGVLEAGTVALLRQYDLAERLDAEGAEHDGAGIAWGGREYFFINIKERTGKSLTAFGQTAITEELYKARDAAGGVIEEDAGDVALHEVESDKPYVTYVQNEVEHRIDADFIAGCDGFHGVSRRSIPERILTTFEKEYPFGWLGIMSRTAPIDEIVYANHPQGFAMCSQRNPQLSRYQQQRNDELDAYSSRALNRVWKATKFSWRFTTLLHRFPDQTDFDQRLQETELEFLRYNEPEQVTIAHQYVGLPY